MGSNTKKKVIKKAVENGVGIPLHAIRNIPTEHNPNRTEKMVW